jgi:prophage antirepressor-like protein
MNEHTLPASIEFEGQGLSIVDHNGKAWLSGVQIADALGFAHRQIAGAANPTRNDGVNDIYRRNRDEFTEDITAVIRQGFALDVFDGLGGGQPEESLSAPDGPSELSPALRSAIECKAHAASLRAYESAKAQIEAGWCRSG